MRRLPIQVQVAVFHYCGSRAVTALAGAGRARSFAFAFDFDFDFDFRAFFTQAPFHVFCEKARKRAAKQITGAGTGVPMFCLSSRAMTDRTLCHEAENRQLAFPVSWSDEKAVRP